MKRKLRTEKYRGRPMRHYLTVSRSCQPLRHIRHWIWRGFVL